MPCDEDVGTLCKRISRKPELSLLSPCRHAYMTTRLPCVRNEASPKRGRLDLVLTPKPDGRTAQYSRQQIVNALLYLAPPVTSGEPRLMTFPSIDRLLVLHDLGNRWDARSDPDCLGAVVRHATGRDVQPTAGILDRQSVKTTEAAGPRGDNAARMMTGRERFSPVGTLDLILAPAVLQVDVQTIRSLQRSRVLVLVK